MKPSTENIVLPVEIQHREFDGKLLLACEIAERNKGAIIGSRVEIHKKIARLPFKVYHAKDALKSSRRILSIIKDGGGLISLLDEEAAVYHTADNYRERRLFGPSLDMIDQVYAWGLDSKNLVLDFEDYNAQDINVTGNPRIDMLRPELRNFYAGEAEKLLKQYGEFLLINTNFGKVNHFVQSLSLDVSSAANKGSEYMQGTHTHRYKVYKAFRDMLPRLATSMGDTQIILRPHPAENQQSWHDLLKPFKNVKIIYQGNIIPWLMASKATLHNGCTTAVESFLLGKMAFCYQPFEPCDYDLSLPNDLSQEFRDINKMIEAMSRQLETGAYNSPSQDQSKLADHFFSHLRGRLASQDLADALIQFCESGRNTDTNPIKKTAAFLHAEGRGMVKRLNALNKEHKNSKKYTDHRFPGISIDDVNAQILEYGRLLKRFSKVEATEIAPHIYYITKTSS